MNSQKSVVLLYIHITNGLRQKSEKTPSTIASNNMKYFELTLTNHVRHLHEKTSRILRGEMKTISKDR